MSNFFEHFRSGFLILHFLMLVSLTPSCKKGENGAPGKEGKNGSSLLSGNGVPAATTGVDGDFYLDTASQQLYGPKTSAGWGQAVLLKGNANVLTDTFTLANEAWSDGIYYVGTAPNLSSGVSAKTFVRPEPTITADLLNAGLVQVYVTSAPDYYQNNWTALPFSFTSFAGYSYNYAAETEIGNLTCYFYFSKITADPPSITSFNLPKVGFKVVMISGTLVGEMTRKQHEMAGQQNN